MPRPFLVKDAKYILLTYAQCADLDYASVASKISDLHGECTIGRERHADGGVHLHVLCEFEPKLSTRESTTFDVGGRHPNILKVGRTPWKAFDYACKDGDIVHRGLERPSEEDSNGLRERAAWEGEYPTKWHYITAATTKDEFWARLGAEDPRSLACSYTNVAKYANWKYEYHAESYQHPVDFSFNLERYCELEQWQTSLPDTPVCSRDR